MAYPDTQPKCFANSFAQIFTSSTSAGGIAFGFNANVIKLVVDAAGPAYLSFSGTSSALATTSGGSYQLSTADGSQDFRNIGTGIAGLSVVSTSTALSMRVGAWG